MLNTERRRKASQSAECHGARGLSAFGDSALFRFQPWEPINCIPYAVGVFSPGSSPQREGVMRRSAVFLHIGIAVVAIAASSQIRAAGAAPCKTDLASCPEIGCAAAGTADAVINKLKRRVPAAGTPQQLTLDDFEKLQERADTLVGQRKSLTAQQRKKLKALSVSSGKVAEGDLVEITGYVIAEHSLPHPNTGESVNCRLKGSDKTEKGKLKRGRYPLFLGDAQKAAPFVHPSCQTLRL
jgi:hypothetical protein